MGRWREQRRSSASNAWPIASAVVSPTSAILVNVVTSKPTQWWRWVVLAASVAVSVVVAGRARRDLKVSAKDKVHNPGRQALLSIASVGPIIMLLGGASVFLAVLGMSDSGTREPWALRYGAAASAAGLGIVLATAIGATAAQMPISSGVLRRSFTVGLMAALALFIGCQFMVRALHEVSKGSRLARTQLLSTQFQQCSHELDRASQSRSDALVRVSDLTMLYEAETSGRAVTVGQAPGPVEASSGVPGVGQNALAIMSRRDVAVVESERLDQVVLAKSIECDGFKVVYNDRLARVVGAVDLPLSLAVALFNSAIALVTFLAVSVAIHWVDD